MHATTTDLRTLADALSGSLPRLDAIDQRIVIATYRVLAHGLSASMEEIGATRIRRRLRSTGGSARGRPCFVTRKVGWSASGV